MTVAAQDLGEGAEDASDECTERVADGDGVTAGDDAGVDLRGVEAGEGMDGEGLVELRCAELAPADAGAGQRAVADLNGARPAGAGHLRVRVTAAGLDSMDWFKTSDSGPPRASG